jgi:plastocyanin
MPRLVTYPAALATLACCLAIPVPAAATPKKPGAIKGTVIFEGEPPERTRLQRDTDPYCAKVAKLSEDVVVTKGKLKDVLVRIKNGTAGTHTAPTAPVLIDQRECMYTPRVVGVIGGQKLAVRNSDGTFHNVRGTRGTTPLWNKPQPAKDPDLSLETGGKPGDVIDVVCDVHPWMRSHAVVMDHPFFAVTGEDGSFEITGLAPGKYTLEAWHPTLGLRSLNIVIGTGAKAVVPARISFKANL